MKNIKSKYEEFNNLSQGKGFYTHPPLLFSQGYFIFNKIQSSLKNKEKISKISKILDLGCAQGAGCFFSLKYFNPNLVIGVDNDKKAINSAIKYQKRNNIKKIKFVKKDIHNFMKSNELKYELIIANGVLPYLLSKRKLIDIFKYIYNSLTDNGVFCFSMFSGNQPFEQKTTVNEISSFSPQNKYKQIALIVNINDLLKIIERSNLSLYNDTFTYQKRFHINIKSKRKKNTQADSNFSYFFLVKKDLYS